MGSASGGQGSERDGGQSEAWQGGAEASVVRGCGGQEGTGLGLGMGLGLVDLGRDADRDLA